MDKYQQFLNSISTQNPRLLEGVSRAYKVIFEQGDDSTPKPSVMSAKERLMALRQAKQATPTQAPKSPAITPNEEDDKYLLPTTMRKEMDNLVAYKYPPRLIYQLTDLIQNLATFKDEVDKTTYDGKVSAKKANDQIIYIYELAREVNAPFTPEAGASFKGIIDKVIAFWDVRNIDIQNVERVMPDINFENDEDEEEDLRY